MNSISILASLLYLSLVISNGQGDELIDELLTEKKFLTWFIAVAIIYNLRGVFGKVGTALFTLLLFTMILNIYPKFIQAFDQSKTNAGNFSPGDYLKSYKDSTK